MIGLIVNLIYRLIRNHGQFISPRQKWHLNEQNLSTLFDRLRNTQRYWKIRRCDLNAMVDSYGPTTFFSTLNPSEYHWDDLHEFLCQRNIISNKKSRSLNSLIAADSVSASLFMDLKFKAMHASLLSDDGHLRKIEYYATSIREPAPAMEVPRTMGQRICGDASRFIQYYNSFFTLGCSMYVFYRLYDH